MCVDTKGHPLKSVGILTNAELHVEEEHVEL